MIKIIGGPAAQGIKILDENGTQISGVYRIEFLPIEVGGLVGVKLHCHAEIDIQVEEQNIEKPIYDMDLRAFIEGNR